MGLEEIADSIFESASTLLRIKDDFSGPLNVINLYPIIDGEGCSISIFSDNHGKADEVRVKAPGFRRSLYRDGKYRELLEGSQQDAPRVLAQVDKEISDAIPVYMTLIAAYERFREHAQGGPLWQNVLLRWADEIHFNGEVNGFDVKVRYAQKSIFPDAPRRRAVEVSLDGSTMHADLDYFTTENGAADDIFRVANAMRRTPDTIETQFRNYLSMKTALYRMGIPRLVPFLEKMYVNVDTQFRAGPMKTA